MKAVYGYALLTKHGHVGCAVEAPHLSLKPMRLLYCVYPYVRSAKAAQRENLNSTIQRVKIEAVK